MKTLAITKDKESEYIKDMQVLINGNYYPIISIKKERHFIIIEY